MKIYFTYIFVFVFGFLRVEAQLYDNIWLFADLGIRSTGLEFTENGPIISHFEAEVDLTKAASSICDSTGNLVLFTDGCNIYNSEGEIVENGEMINPGETWDNYCSPSQGYPQVSNSSLFLPWPESSNTYILFHARITFTAGSPEVSSPTSPVYYSTVSFSDDSEPIVQEKNIILYDGSPDVMAGRMLANRHANGRDWWIVNRLRQEGGFLIHLLTPEGIEGPFYDDSAYYFPNHNFGSGGEPEFSSDGTRYIYHSEANGTEIQSFDRETGAFELEGIIELYDALPDVVLTGAGLSPNGRFAYISDWLYVYQYDLEAENIEESRVVIHEFTNPDSLFIHPHSVNFQLGPDCRLYNFMNSGRFIHRINYPDLQGEACGFELNAIELPFSAFRDQPQFPHFRLGPKGDEGSPCVYEPTSTALVEATQASLKVYPNPSTGPIRLFLPAGESPGLWRLFDLQGRPLQEVPIRGGETVRVDVQAGLAAGTYIWQLWREGRVVEWGRVVRP